jgi:hypothetical protein
LVRESITVRGRLPTNREIGDTAGLFSPATVACHLHELARQGFLPQAA